MTVITASSESDQRPVTIEVLKQMVNTASCEPKKLIEQVLEQLKAKSSKHKFIVQVSEIDVNEGSQVQCRCAFGAVWESGKDGYVSFKRELADRVLMVSVYWVYID